MCLKSSQDGCSLRADQEAAGGEYRRGSAAERRQCVGLSDGTLQGICKDQELRSQFGVYCLNGPSASCEW